MLTERDRRWLAAKQIKLVKKSADSILCPAAEKKCICSWLPLVTRGAFSSSFSMKEAFSLFRGLPGCFSATRMNSIATPTEPSSCQSDSLEESRLRTRVSVAVQDQRLAHRERVKIGLKGQRTWLQILTLSPKGWVACDMSLSVPQLCHHKYGCEREWHLQVQHEGPTWTQSSAQHSPTPSQCPRDVLGLTYTSLALLTLWC